MRRDRELADLEARIEASRRRGPARVSWGYHVRVSMQHRYLSMTVPKVACTTVKHTLHALEGLEPVHDDENLHDQGTELTLSTFRSQEIAAILLSEDWLRFAFVRNPYQRILSAWKSKIVSTSDVQYQDLRATLESAYGGSSVDETMPPTVPFRDFVKYVVTSNDPEVVDDGHWDLQVNVLLYDLIPYDTIGRFESFGEEFVRILRRLGAPLSVLRIAREVTNATAPGPPLQEVYDADLADAVFRKYEPDFEAFGYDRHSWRSGADV